MKNEEINKLIEKFSVFLRTKSPYNLAGLVVLAEEYLDNMFFDLEEYKELYDRKTRR